MKQLFFAGRSLATLVVAKIIVATASVRRMSDWAQHSKLGSGLLDEDLRLYRRIAARFPASCLVKALALQRLYSQNGRTTRLKIGVKRDGRTILAHAWLCRGNEVLIGENVDLQSYTELPDWQRHEITKLID